MVFVADGDENGNPKRFFDSFKMLPK